MRDTDTQPSTDELLERLLESALPESYLSSLPFFDQSFHGLLTAVASAKGRSRAEVIRHSGVTTSYVYQVFSGARQPSRDVAVMLALGAGATLKEAQDLLTRAGLGQSPHPADSRRGSGRPRWACTHSKDAASRLCRSPRPKRRMVRYRRQLPRRMEGGGGQER